MKFFITIFLFCVSYNFFAQKIENIKVKQKGDSILIHYDLQFDKSSEIFYVFLYLTTDNGATFTEIVDASGEIGDKVTSGINKKIVWMPFAKDPAFKAKGAKFKIKAGINQPGMVLVEGGIFTMGNSSGEADEKPEHQVKLNSFYIDKFEVTGEEYQKVMGGIVTTCSKCPVLVNHDNAKEYAQKIGKRLLSEAEWEYAARGGIKSQGFKYSGSNVVEDVAFCSKNSSGLQQAGQKKPNELGVYDMSGNAWEWCNDYYVEDYYGRSPLDNPQGSFAEIYYVQRGGSFNSKETDLRSTNRHCNKPTLSNLIGNAGFRCAKSIP